MKYRVFILSNMLLLVLFINSKCQDKSSQGNTITNEDTSFIRKEYHLVRTRKNNDGRQVYEKWTNDKDTSKSIIILYVDNKLSSLGYYRNNLHDGALISCYDNGVVWIRANYVNGEKHGPFKYYDEKGELFAVEEYKNGTLVSTKK